MSSRQTPSDALTNRSTLTWFLIFGVLVTLIAPPAGLVTAGLVAIVTATRPELRRDRLWTGMVALLMVLLAIITVITAGSIVA